MRSMQDILVAAEMERATTGIVKQCEDRGRFTDRKSLFHAEAANLLARTGGVHSEFRCLSIRKYRRIF